MRRDALGFFWEDRPVVKEPKAEVAKRTPPERTWERDDYLPGLEEARQFNVDQFTDEELVQAALNEELLVFDIEIYVNYFLIAFYSLQSKKVVYFERTTDIDFDYDDLYYSKLKWVVDNFCIISFNGVGFDIPILSLALAGVENYKLKEAATEIIVNGTHPRDVLKRFKVKSLKLNHVDLIEVAPLRASLKIYGGRLHAPRMQDLPFHPDTLLSEDQITIVRWYCVNDLKTTVLLHDSLREQLDLRVTLSREYRLDLRSRSDAQIAESIISAEMEKLSGCRPTRPAIEPGTEYRYNVPHFINFQTNLMQSTLYIVRNAKFFVSEYGNIGMPEELKSLEIRMANGVYRMGIGGLHSSETCTAHIADDNTVLIDRDVASYYPAIILNLGLYPHHLGTDFLKVYKTIVDRRLAAKKAGNKVVADSLKITVNGSFGKLGNAYSVLYSPDLLIQVTITGQLSLLMLIEALELNGISVVSANTDGIVIKCPVPMLPVAEQIFKNWEEKTGFQTEETRYKALYSRDVNNYIAIKMDGKAKTKGAYAPVGLSKNPANEICVNAVLEYLTKNIPIEKTIRECKDITQFVSVRKVKGGAVKNGVYLGSSIRWYYVAGEEGEIVYANSGNKVPKSEGAKPLMDLPSAFPVDIDYARYESEALEILKDVGENSLGLV